MIRTPNQLHTSIYNKAKKCRSCGAYKGHGPRCPKIGLKEARKQLKMYYESWLKLETRERKIRKMFRIGWRK